MRRGSSWRSSFPYGLECVFRKEQFTIDAISSTFGDGQRALTNKDAAIRGSGGIAVASGHPLADNRCRIRRRNRSSSVGRVESARSRVEKCSSLRSVQMKPPNQAPGSTSHRHNRQPTQGRVWVCGPPPPNPRAKTDTSSHRSFRESPPKCRARRRALCRAAGRRGVRRFGGYCDKKIHA
jgi:hypothetical protein